MEIGYNLVQYLRTTEQPVPHELSSHPSAQKPGTVRLPVQSQALVCVCLCMTCVSMAHVRFIDALHCGCVCMWSGSTKATAQISINCALNRPKSYTYAHEVLTQYAICCHNLCVPCGVCMCVCLRHSTPIALECVKQLNTTNGTLVLQHYKWLSFTSQHFVTSIGHTHMCTHEQTPHHNHNKCYCGV